MVHSIQFVEMKFGIRGLNNATLLVGASIRPVSAIHSFIGTKADLVYCVSTNFSGQILFLIIS
jgi:hypothetical protein